MGSVRGGWGVSLGIFSKDKGLLGPKFKHSRIFRNRGFLKVNLKPLGGIGPKLHINMKKST